MTKKFSRAAAQQSVETLFFDARCPLCRREVALLQSLARPTLHFQDIHTARADGLPGTDTLLRTLHLQRAEGAMVTGLLANVAVWQHTRFGLPWRLLLLPGIRALAEWAYEYWAQRRYARLYACSLANSGPRRRAP